MVRTTSLRWFGLVATLVVSLAAGSLRAADEASSNSPDAAHAAHDHGEHAHDEHGSVDPLTVDVDLGIWTMLVFGLLLLTLWKFAWGPISKALDERERTITEQIAAAERANEDAKRVMAEYEAKLSAAADEVRAMLEEARRDAEHTKQEILAEARDEAATERARGLREVETAKDQALKELAEASANHAIDLAAKILRAQLNPADHKRLIEESMAAFPRGDARLN